MCVIMIFLQNEEADNAQIHHVEEEQWLGGLLHANDELVHALMSFEQFDRSIDADSDSDDELAEQAHLYRSTPPLAGHSYGIYS